MKEPSKSLFTKQINDLFGELLCSGVTATFSPYRGMQDVGISYILETLNTTYF